MIKTVVNWHERGCNPEYMIHTIVLSGDKDKLGLYKTYSK